MNLTIEDYIIEDQLGTGTFASVKLATHPITNIKVAIKIMSKKNFLEKESLIRFEREVKLLQDLYHPLIAQFYELLEDENNFYLIMENVQCGNMLDFVNNNGELTEKDAKIYFSQLISVLSFLHNEKLIAHRDLKAENLLLDRNHIVRVIDFGLSNVFTNNNTLLKTACGSPAYAPPEMIKGEKYDTLSDIWSSGILLYAMVCGQLPFEDENIQRLLQKIVYSEPKYPPNISIELKDLISKLLTKDPKNRINLEQIKKHQWLNIKEISNILDSNFFVPEGFFLIKIPFNPEPLDLEIFEIMKNLNINIENLINDLNLNLFNSTTAIFKMIKKEKIIDLMKSLQIPDGYSLLKKTEVSNSAIQRFNKIPLPILKTTTTQRRASDSINSNVNDKNVPKILKPNLANTIPSQRRTSVSININSPINMRKRSYSMTQK